MQKQKKSMEDQSNLSSNAFFKVFKIFENETFDIHNGVQFIPNINLSSLSKKYKMYCTVHVWKKIVHMLVQHDLHNDLQI